ncbi:MAG: CoA transferase, partial [Afipia sp.]
VTRDDLIERLNDSDIAFAEVNTMDDLSKHPHLRRIEVETPNGAVAYPAPASIVVGEQRPYGAVPSVGNATGELPRGKKP